MGVLGLVGFGRPDERDFGLALGQDMFGQDADGVAEARGVGLGLGRPLSEARRQAFLERVGQGEVGVNRRAARRVGVGVVDVGVAGGSDSDGGVLESMIG